MNRFLILFSALIMASGCGESGTQQQVHEPVPISSIDTLILNNILQVIKTNGADKELPLLLFLHGGPGESVMQRSNEITGNLEEEFLVVHWDQRGAGATAALNPSDPPPSLDLMLSDAKIMVDSILRKFNKDQLYLVAHSWGTVPGFELARTSPEKITAFIAVSPLVNEIQSAEILLDTLKNHFQENGNARATGELDTVSVPVENLEQMIAVQRWMSEYNGETVTDEQVAEFLPYLRQWEKQWWQVYRVVARIDRNNEPVEFECPIIFILGADDLQTNHVLAQNYFETIEAPSKKLFLIDGAGHNIPGQVPDSMQEKIREVIKPAK